MPAADDKNNISAIGLDAGQIVDIYAEQTPLLHFWQPIFDLAIFFIRMTAKSNLRDKNRISENAKTYTDARRIRPNLRT